MIRLAIAADIPEILRLIHQPDMSAETPVTPQRALAIFNALRANPGQEFYVAVEGDRIVGTFSLIVIQHLSHSGARSAVIEDFVVDQPLRGRGIGGGMLEFAIGKAREMGCYKIALSSGLHRSAAHRFYEKRGFRRQGYSYVC